MAVTSGHGASAGTSYNVLHMHEDHFIPLLWEMHIAIRGDCVTEPAGGVEGSVARGGYRQDVPQTVGPSREVVPPRPAQVNREALEPNP